MKLPEFDRRDSAAVIDLFAETFAASEGDEEGAVIRGLVTDLLAITPERDITGFVASADDGLVGCILFTRIAVPTGQLAFMLSPVAVATGKQGGGVGQALLRYGIEQLRERGVELLFTYGSPDYYGRVGFEPLSEETIRAPFPLTQPHGWLAQSLTGQPVAQMAGATRCVEAFNNPAYW